MRKSTKIVGVLMVAGIVAAGGSAATGNGFTKSGTAANTQFIGGTVTETVVGANLSNISYTTDTSDATGRTLTGYTLTFADANADGKVPTVSNTGSTAGAFTCDAIGDHTINSATVHHTSVCDDSGSGGAAAVNVSSISITVS